MSVSSVGAFDVTNPNTIAWAAQNSAKLITNLRAQQEATVREVIADAERARVSQGQAQRLIYHTVGLTPQQGRAVTNYMLGLYDAQLKDWSAEQVRRRWSLSPWRGGLLSDDRIDTLVGQYGARLRRYRAEMIARTEMMQATNRGKVDTWRSLQSNGYIAPDAVRRWVVGHDDRACELCVAMNGKTASVAGGLFTNTPVGYDVEGPPLHPDCRCTTVLETNPAYAQAALPEPADLPTLDDVYWTNRDYQAKSIRQRQDDGGVLARKVDTRAGQV